MKKFFYPEGVAVIGASADKNKVGYALLHNIQTSYPGRCFPINPRYEEIDGLKCYPDVSGIPETVDLAIIFIPAARVPQALEDCGKKGIRRIMIQSAGFAETGAEGRALQDRCIAVAREYGLRLWGPNCMGMVNGQAGTAASFMRPGMWKQRLRPGGVSLIVQSGMLAAGFLMQVLQDNYFGLNLACSIGNRSDVNECDLLEYMADDPKTEIVAMYLESVSDPKRFAKAVRGLKKPVVLLKGGTSSLGAKAAVSHTASLAGNSEVSEGFFRQLGILRTWDFVEMMDMTKALNQWRGRTGGKRAAVVTFSGAAGIVAADHLSRQGMTLAELSPESIERLKTVYPPWMPPENPLDLWPAIERNGWAVVYDTVIDVLLKDPQVDGIHFHIFVSSEMLENNIEHLAPLKGSKKPAAFWILGDTENFKKVRDRVEELGAAVYPEIERGVTALRLMADLTATNGRK